MTRYYELTFIVKPDVDDTNLAALIEKVSGFVTTEGGQVLKITHWGVRRLMYPIRKFRDGRYVFTLLELDASTVIRIETRLKLIEDIIRYLLIRADDDLDVSKILAAPSEVQAPIEVQAPVEVQAPIEAQAAPEPVAGEAQPEATATMPASA